MTNIIKNIRLLWYQSIKITPFGSYLFITIITNAFLAFAGLISGVVAARLLGPQGRGELAVIQTWPTLLSTLALLGLPNALVYFSAREPEHAGRWLSTATILATLSSVPFMLIGYMLMPWLLSVQRIEIIEAARAYLWLIPVQAIVAMPNHSLRGRNDLLIWNLIRPMPNLLWIGILLVSVQYSFNNPIILSQVFLIMLALLFFPKLYVVLRFIPGSFYPKASSVHPLLSYGLPTGLSSVPETLNLRLDQMLMAGLLGSEILGLYVVGVAWSGVVAPIINALESVLLPRIAGAKIENQTSLLAQGIRLGVAISLFLAILSAIATPVVIPLLFGADFKPAILATIILCLAAGVAAINRILIASLLSLAQPHSVLIAQCIGLIVTMGLLWILLPPFQLFGAAIASLASYIITLVVLICILKRKTVLSFTTLLLPKYSDLMLLLARMRLFKNRNLL